MNLKEKSELFRREKISSLCKGEILDLGCYSKGENIKVTTNLHNFLKERHKVVKGVDLRDADYIQDLNEIVWNISEKFDTIVAGGLFEHIENPIQFLKNCNKLLNKNGRLIMTTANATSLIYLKNPNWCVGNEYKATFEQDNSHIHGFTSGMLKNLMEMTGFKEIEFIYRNGYVYNPIAYLICKLIPRLRGDIMIWGQN